MAFRYDETHPQLIVVYTGEHHDSSDYSAFVQRWLDRFEDGQRFGVLMVSEPHEHDHDDPQQKEEEAKLAKLLNDFRRDHRQIAIEKMAGFATVYDAEDEYLKEYLQKHENGWEQLQTDADNQVRYMFGRGDVTFMMLMKQNNGCSNNLRFRP